MELENERLEQISDELAKYAISSMDEAKRICDEKGVDVSFIVKTIKENANEIAIEAYYLGTAIAIRKDTKLASYVAMDIGEGLQAFCMPDSEAAINRAGLGHGYQASMYIKNNGQLEPNSTDYNMALPFMELSNDELLRITSAISKRVEEVMQA